MACLSEAETDSGRMPMNTHTWKNRALAIGFAGTTAITVVCSASAAPVLTNTAALKQALPSDVQGVRWGWGGGAFFGGLLAGGLIGAALAQPYYYGYGYPAYGYGYGYAPYYYPYAYSYPAYSYSYGYPYGGYGGYYGGWRGYGYGWRGAAWRGGVAWRGTAWRGAAWRGTAWRGASVAHHVRYR